MRRQQIVWSLVGCALLLSGPILRAEAQTVLGPPQGEPAAAQGRAVTPLDVARIRSAGEIAISPDGSEIAYTLSVPRQPGGDRNGPAWTELHVVAFDGTRDRPFITGEVNVAHLGWSPDGGYISYLARRADDDHTSIYVIPAEAGESIRLYEHETNVLTFDWRPDGRAIAFVANEAVPEDLAKLREMGFDQEIYEEDWLSRRLYVLELPNGPGGPAGALRSVEVPGQPWSVVWDADGRRLLTDLSPTPLVDDRYMYRRLHVIDPASGEVLAEIENPGKLGAFDFSPDGRTIALISGVDINDPREGRLMVVPAGGGALRDLLPELEGQGHVESFSFVSRDRLVYLAGIGVGSRLGRVKTDGGDAEILFESSDPVFGGLSVDTRGRNAALVGESPTFPQEVFAARVDRAGEPDRLTEANEWLSGIRFARQEIVRWTAEDGLEIEGLLIHPLEGSGSAPTIVVAHGGPESHFKNGWLTSYSRPGQLSAARGYAVFYPNYRGSTGRGVAFAKADQGDGAGAEFDDVLAGLDYLIARGVADAERVGITGGSYGGYFTAWASTRHSQRFAAGVMFVGISDQLSKVGTSDIPREMELVHWLTNPYENPDLFLERSPIMYVNDARTPLLIMHGKEDPRVNPGQSRELYRGIKMQTDTPVRLVLYPGEGHGNRRAAARYDYTLRMLRWFDWFLKEGKTELPPWRVDYELSPEVM